MLGLRNIPISQRLWLILLTSVLMLLVLAGLLLKQHRDDLYAAKALKTRHVVESAGGILRHFHDLEQAGLPREQAQLQASAVMRRLRYNGEDYFWLEDLDTRLVMHPNASLEGKRMSGTRDADGKQIFDEMVELAKRDGAGLMHYRWPRPGSEQPLEKVSYVELFEPWGWIIGSGIYVDDVEAEFRSQALHALLLLLGIVLLLAALILLIARSIASPLDRVVGAMENIASGEADLTRNLDSHWRDELTALSRHFNAFTNKLRGLVGQSLQTADNLDQASTVLPLTEN